MEGFKLIKTKFDNNKQIIGVNFSGKDDYNVFITQVKKVYKIHEELNVNIFSNDFIINEDIFSSFVAQYICSNDFVLDIKLNDPNSFLNAIASTSCDYFKPLNSSGNETSQILPVIEQQPIFEAIEISGDPDFIHYSQERLPTQSCTLNPSTEEIKKLLNIQRLLNISRLENKHRTEIAKSVIYHILNNNPNRKLLREDFLELSESIIEIFPSEVKATYYVPFAKGHLAKGKLYDAYNNARAKLSAAGVIKRRIKSKPENKYVEESNSLVDDVENLVEILKSGCDEWELVRENWKKTHLFRQDELKNGELKTIDYMEKYKVLENEKNYELFQIDFNILYPGSKNIYEWKHYYHKVLDISKKLKDNAVKEILTYIESTENEDAKLALSLMLIPYILPTSRKKSKIEAQESFICYCKNILIADDEIRNSIKRIKLETQPKIYLIGDSTKTICLAYVDVCGKKIKFENPLNAIEICFHCFMGMNIRYPKNCEHVWIFIQKIIFQINTPWDIDLPAVNTLINDLQK